MRKLIATEFLSLDGVMQGPGSPDEDREGGFELGGWQMQFVDEDQMKAAGEGIAQTDAYLFGRKTYEIMAAYWPNQPDTDPFAATLNGTPKYVVSTTLTQPLAWQNTTLIKGDVVSQIRAVKERPGGNITVLGSGELVQTLIRAGLIDEFGLMINPLVLGSGKRLFRDELAPLSLELIRSTTTSKGVIIATYRPTDRTT
jgi:dihydrofolate reductase